MLDDAIEDASPGFVKGDNKYNAEIVAENLAERMGLVYDDMPTKERLDLYDQAYTGLIKKKDIPEDFAIGGRVGFRIGSESGKDTSGREYASDTAASKAVATSPSRDDGPPGGDNNQPPSQKN